MKILYIASKPPMAPFDGESVRTFHLLRGLAALHQVTFACPPLAGSDPTPPTHIIKTTGIEEFIPIPIRGRSAATLARAVLTLRPHFFVAAKDRDFERFVVRSEGKFDVIHLDGLVAFNYFSAARRACKSVSVDLRDAWSLLYERMSSGKSGIAGAFFRVKRLLLERVERDIVRNAGKLIVISDVDREFLSKKYGRKNDTIFVVKNGAEIDLSSTEEAESASGPARTLVFTGAMDYFPNQQAAVWFIDHIYPRLARMETKWKVYIVGRSPSAAILDRANANVIITGTVPDVAEYLEKADIVIAPLRSGAGLKNKVLEGMASGKAVIGSSIAFEGVGGASGTHYLEANSESEWVEAICRLSADPELRAEIARDGKSFVRKEFHWPVIIQNFAAIVAAKT